MKVLFLLSLFCLPQVLISAEPAAALTLAEDVDILWVTISAALVFFMQAGFLMLEAGLVRAKNTINVAIKNLIDYIAGSIGFFIVGFGLMFGSSVSGIFGCDLFMLDGLSTGKQFAFFLFQIAFMGTAATIVSGAVAERIRFHAYLIVSILISVIIYPVFGHWVWGGGWLARMGFIDFAGSTVVHSVGGWIGLAGALVLGPRKDKFDTSGNAKHIYGHDLPLSVLGTLILWLGWFGFNGGSTLALTDNMPLIIVNTCLSACAGGFIAIFVSLAFSSFTIASIEDIVNGVIGGLVGITASCHVVTPKSAILIGAVCGILVVLNVRLMEKVFKIDDVVGAFTVHAVCGIWGTLAVPLFARSGLDGGTFLVQLTGVGVCAAWSFGLGFITFFLLKLFGILRVSDEHEQIGLNISEHGAKTSWIDLMSAMQSLAHKQGMPEKISEIEQGTEAGAIASLFNKILENINSVVTSVNLNAVKINSISDNLNGSADEINQTIVQESTKMQNISAFLAQINDSFKQAEQATVELVRHRSENTKLAELLQERFDYLSGELDHSTKHTLDSHSFSVKGEEDLKKTVKGMSKIQESSRRVREVSTFLIDISEQLTLLSLNASIEAARTGEKGHGFSVIAHEINSLSDTTLKHTREAAEYIEEIDEAIKGGALALETTVDSFHTIRNEIDILKRIMNILIKESSLYRETIAKMIESFQLTGNEIDSISKMVMERKGEINDVFTAIWDVNNALENLQQQSVDLHANSRSLFESSEHMHETVGMLDSTRPTN